MVCYCVLVPPVFHVFSHAEGWTHIESLIREIRLWIIFCQTRLFFQTKGYIVTSVKFHHFDAQLGFWTWVAMLIIFLQNDVPLKNSRDAVRHIYCTTWLLDYCRGWLSLFCSSFCLSKSVTSERVTLRDRQESVESITDKKHWQQLFFFLHSCEFCYICQP